MPSAGTRMTQPESWKLLERIFAPQTNALNTTAAAVIASGSKAPEPKRRLKTMTATTKTTAASLDVMLGSRAIFEQPGKVDHFIVLVGQLFAEDDHTSR